MIRERALAIHQTGVDEGAPDFRVKVCTRVVFVVVLLSLLASHAMAGRVPQLRLDERGLTTIDHWDADLCAIGITRKGEPRRLVYVSTYNKQPERYFYECEEAAGLPPDEYTVTGSEDDVDFERLLYVLEKHLKQ